MTPSPTTRTRPARRSYGIALLTCLVVAAGCGASSDSTDSERFPDVELHDATGGSVSSGTFVGEPLVVNFWYSTCPPCAKELGDFAQVHSELGDAVRFVGVNPLDDADTMVAFASERGVGYELYRDEVSELQMELGITAFPATVLVDAEGHVVETLGVLDADELRSEITALLDSATTA